MELVDKRKAELIVGALVVYFDRYRRRCNAIVTAVHGKVQMVGRAGGEQVLDIPCINIVITSQDGDKTDQYGRQVERETSVVHANGQYGRAGYYYCFPDEEQDCLPIEENVATQK